ncbi:hypothetical protein C8Q73DRAFT_661163, partial [Cubamyces lactineus]
RCTDCISHAHFCRDCLLAHHRHNPFHRLLRWDASGGFWERISMADLGFELHAGHSGRPCSAPGPRNARDMVIVHCGGVVEMRVNFCRCASAQDEIKQLLALGLFPGSWKRPQTAYTIDLLNSFQLLSFHAQTSAHDFYAYLRRLTNNVLADEVVVSYPAMSKDRFVLTTVALGSVPRAYGGGERVRVPSSVQTPWYEA